MPHVCGKGILFSRHTFYILQENNQTIKCDPQGNFQGIVAESFRYEGSKIQGVPTRSSSKIYFTENSSTNLYILDVETNQIDIITDLLK